MGPMGSKTILARTKHVERCLSFDLFSFFPYRIRTETLTSLKGHPYLFIQEKAFAPKGHVETVKITEDKERKKGICFILR